MPLITREDMILLVFIAAIFMTVLSLITSMYGRIWWRLWFPAVFLWMAWVVLQ
jgi:hypothetical protein